MKNEIRKANKERRAKMSREEVARKSFDASKLFLSSPIYKNAIQIMLYMPLGNETDTLEIINAAFNDKKTVVLPVTDKANGEITAYEVCKETAFEKGAFSILEPQNAKKADMSKTDVVLVPGIAFSKSGARVGFGKGCYDKLLALSNAVKVGFCYDFQLCYGIKPEWHDVKMDYIVTENEIIECKCE